LSVERRLLFGWGTSTAVKVIQTLIVFIPYVLWLA